MPPATKLDLVGQKFHRFTVIARTKATGNKPATGWLCRCECGQERVVPTAPLMKGERKSCGCLRNDFHKVDPRGRLGKTKDLTGMRFGRLVCVSPAGRNEHGHHYWNCKCDCGGEKTTQASVLKRGDCKSCGCLLSGLLIKHGEAKRDEHGIPKRTKEYRTWRHIIDRCHNPKCRLYPDYGGRGIFVWDGWRKDFLAFKEHVGAPPSPDHSLDRIEVNKGYEPGNVRWADATQQARNRRNTVYVEDDGERVSLAEACEKHGLKYESVRYQIRGKGLSFDDVIKKAASQRRQLDVTKLELT